MNSVARIAGKLAYTAFVAWLITIILKYDFTLSEQTKMTFNRRRVCTWMSSGVA
ncbi:MULTISPECIES: hypothetical protein [Brevibacillus]|uniref:hypothetical protein n=1 Tax=Brevibacillus TaxID=55080 RepID=UPI001605DC1D|nr:MULTISPECIES: hypothetical protein [Brevibacillus]MCM3080973.1 hypothetical protein [Brevibacillus invocatus]MCM3431175.1 hypothetical protein [Brevibacillus invocatus]MDH4618470.1 hypothetical protein [Brevibacillus sp. AY1]